MNILTIGGAKGIFEIFVPGIFLFLNFIAVGYLLPFNDDETKNLILESVTNPTIGIVFGVSFGYLLGVLLRLFRTDLPDTLSAKWARLFHRYARISRKEYRLWAIEKFPYIGWLGVVLKRYLSSEVHEFYNLIWGPRPDRSQNKQFFNFCKTLISSEDDRATAEIYAAEALSRIYRGNVSRIIVRGDPFNYYGNFADHLYRISAYGITCVFGCN